MVPLPLRFSTDLKSNLFLVLPVKLLISGFDTIRFHKKCCTFSHWPIFHVSFSFCHIILILTVHIIPYWHLKQSTIDIIEIFKDIGSGFNSFVKIFSMNLIEFFLILSLTVIFSLPFYSYKIS